MKLIVITGGADPILCYKKVYELLKQKAEERKFSDCLILNFHGHYSFDETSYLNIEKTSEYLSNYFETIEKEEEEYIVLCRSYGCMPFIEILKNEKFPLQKMRKVIFLGTIPLLCLV